MVFLIRPLRSIGACIRRARNARHLVQRLRQLKDLVLGQLHELTAQQQVLRAEVQALRGGQHSLLQASVYLVETHQQQCHELQQQHTQVLCRLAALEQRCEALQQQRQEQAREIQRLRQQLAGHPSRPDDLSPFPQARAA